MAGSMKLIAKRGFLTQSKVVELIPRKTKVRSSSRAQDSIPMGSD